MKKFNKNLIGIVLAIVLMLGFTPSIPTHAATSPTLGVAESFVILAKTLISSVPLSSIVGDVGLDNEGSNYEGLTSLEVSGTIFDTNGTGPDAALGNNPTLMTSARAANSTAFGALDVGVAGPCGNGTSTSNGSGSIAGIDWTGTGVIELAGRTLVPGIYCADVFQLTTSSSLTLDGTLASDVWIFRALGTADSLVTTPGVGANVVFSDGLASACNVWWRVAGSATIGGGTDFIGNILAATSISMGTGATLEGRALAYTGAVTLDSNTISGCAVALVSPHLTLNKIVVGGSASESDWTLTATGPMTLSGRGAAGSTDVVGDVAPGIYTLSESVGPSSHTASSWSCVKNGATTVNPITLTYADTAICTITNTYIPSYSSGGFTYYGCKDVNALNYEYFAASNPALCVYAATATTTTVITAVATTTLVFIPKLPNTGLPPKESTPWNIIVLSSILILVSASLIVVLRKRRV